MRRLLQPLPSESAICRYTCLLGPIFLAMVPITISRSHGGEKNLHVLNQNVKIITRRCHGSHEFNTTAGGSKGNGHSRFFLAESTTLSNDVVKIPRLYSLQTFFYRFASVYRKYYIERTCHNLIWRIWGSGEIVLSQWSPSLTTVSSKGFSFRVTHFQIHTFNYSSPT